jgi:predicted nucleotidyltransferase
VSGEQLLGDRERAIARRVVAEEESQREHVVVYLSGAHAYGFPSPDSDLDLKSIHVAPTAALLGMTPPVTTFDRAEIVEGVEIDYTSNELGPALAGILRGNGNFAERALCPSTLLESELLAELREVARGALSRRMHRHYRGFAETQRRELERTPTAKRLLYVLRTALTGTHVLETGELIADLGALVAERPLEGVAELVARKQGGERTPLTETERDRWSERVRDLLDRLDAARDRSPLPEEPSNVAEVEAFLLRARRARFA